MVIKNAKSKSIVKYLKNKLAELFYLPVMCSLKTEVLKMCVF